MMASVWYAYLEIAELMGVKRRRAMGRNRGNPPDIARVRFGYLCSPSTTSAGASVPHVIIQHNSPRAFTISEDKIDSSSTSRHPGGDVEPFAGWVPVVSSADKCQSGQHFTVTDGAKPMAEKKCVADYRHYAIVTRGGQMRDTDGGGDSRRGSYTPMRYPLCGISRL